MNTPLAFKFLSILSLLATLFFVKDSLASIVNINFTGFIMPGSCNVDLDRPALNLGNIDMLSLQKGAILANVSGFNATVRNCYLSQPSTYRPAIEISGEGFNADGKFLFRSSDSSSRGIGVALYKNASSPQYSDLSLKSGDYIDLGGVGTIPADTTLPFFVGVTCGSASNCVSSNIAPGRLISRIMINLRYY